MTEITTFLEYMFLGQSMGVWLSFFAIIFALLVFDLGIMARKALVVTPRQSLKQTGFYMLLALIFGIWIWVHMGAQDGIDYYTAYMIELSLSLDNLFVMSVILAHFKIPPHNQHRILFWGILGVLVMRGLMIGSGLAVIQHFHWVLFIFAGLLIITGAKMLLGGNHDDDDDNPLKDSKIVSFLSKHMRCTPDFHGNRFFIRQENSKTGTIQTFATPLFMALVCIEFMDVIFAIDSVPAVFAITTAPFIVYSSNIFAILGLRSMYFAVIALLDRFKYMNYALSIVLIFIGGKIFYSEFVEKIDPLYSLAITVTLLVGGAIFSLIKTQDDSSKN